MSHKVAFFLVIFCADLLAVCFFCAYRGADTVVDTAELSE